MCIDCEVVISEMNAQESASVLLKATHYVGIFVQRH